MLKHLILAAYLLLSLFSLSSCSERGKVLATVGKYTIREKDAEQREKIAKIFYPMAQEKDIGLHQLIESYAIAQILENRGMELNKEVLEHESERIDQQTKAADKLNKIKEIFGNDKEAYLQIFVLPTYAERIIYFGYFLHDSEAQAQPLKTAKELLALAKEKPNNFLTEAKKRGLNINSYYFDKKLGFRNPALDKIEQTQIQNLPPEAKQAFLESKANALKLESAYFNRNKVFQAKKGTVIQEPFDASDFFLLLQVSDKPTAQRIPFNGVYVQKEKFADWLAKEKEKFEIKIN